MCAPAGLKEVVVTRKAGEAIIRGAHVYAPGVLAMSKGVAKGDMVAVSIARELRGANVTLPNLAQACSENEIR